MLLGSAYGKVEIDASGVRRGVTDASTSLKRLQAVGADVGRALGNVGRTLTIGLTLPIVALGGAALKAATDFEETRNKTIVVFEDMADAVVDSSEKSARALGINKEAYMDYASSIGAALKAGGMNIKEVTQLSEQAVKHFADLASFHNARVEDVARAWESAIRGQYEPIQRYFPFITNEYLKTYGVANGMLDANTKNLTANQRAVIINAIALDEKLNPAINDFAETSGGLANQSRIMKAQFHDLLIELGTNLLPIALQVAEALNSMLEKFNNMSPAMQKVVLGVGAFLAVIGPIANTISAVVTAVSSISGVLTGLGVTLPAVGAALGSIGTVITGTVIPAIGAFLVAAAPIIIAVGLIVGAIALLYWAFKTNFGGIRTTAEQLWFIIKWGFNQMWQTINEGARAGLDVLREGWNNAIENIQERFAGFGEWIRTAWQNILNFFGQIRTRIVQIFQIDWSIIGRMIIRGIITGLLGGNSVLASAVTNVAKTILGTLQKTLSIRSPSAKAAWMGRMTSEGYLQGMAAAMSSRRIADLLARPVSQVAQGAQMMVTQNFSTGLSIREARRVVAENNQQMLQGLETALGGL